MTTPGYTFVSVSTAKPGKLDNWLASAEGAESHGDGDDMSDVIETFEMYDLDPVSSRL